MSSPISVALTHPSSWHCEGDENGPYHILRFNFLVETRPLGDTGYGSAVDTVTVPQKVQMENRRTTTIQYAEFTSESLVQSHIRSSNLLTKIGADARLDSNLLGTPGFTTALEDQITESFQSEQTFSSSQTTEYTQEEETTFKVESGAGSLVYAAPYRRHQMTVRLNHFDFLTVKYERTHRGLRLRRVKSPHVSTPDRAHTNYARSGLALGNYYYWRREGDASKNLIDIKNYEDNHINPAHARFDPDKNSPRQYYDNSEFARIPSLYKIANAAFPLKDSQRRDSWSEEDLLILNDLIEPDSAWVWESRRRLRRKALDSTIRA